MAIKPPRLTLIQLLLQDILRHEQKRLDRVLGTLLEQNAMHGGSAKAFLHKGAIFSLEPMKIVRGHPVKPLVNHLAEDADYLVEMRKQLASTEQRLRQGLSVVVTRCAGHQDLRDALPDVLVRELPSLRGLQRTRPEGFMLAGNPRLKEQFDSVCELALQYAANQLFF
jgi:hypothetical protein